MNANHSTARPAPQYQPTIIESALLITRLTNQIAFVKTDPIGFARQSARDLFTKTNAMCALGAVIAVAIVLALNESSVGTIGAAGPPPEDSVSDVMLMDVTTGPGRVGMAAGKGEGSGPEPKPAHGGGGSGNHDPIPPQTGKLPPPSAIPAPIPIAPPVNPPSLPVAGIDIDPALWKDLKAPVYGDPRSTSEIPSKGPGDGDGIGSNRGTGIGPGDGPGYGPGTDGNTGGGPKQTGCCGPGGGSDRDGQPYRGAEVEQRARLLSKPEPQYTEEARRNQISGTVMLRAVFSSNGEVIQIRALHALPFGLTERAIAAARQIKFVPAMKGGRPVSVYMQLEYNFNLY